MTYRLGRNVTEQAQGLESRGTIVVSVRLDAREFDALSDYADGQDRSISEVVRAVIRRGVPSMNEITAATPSAVWFDR